MKRAMILAVALAALAGPADAAVLFSATETAPGPITQTATLGMTFWFGYFDTQIHGQCAGCLAAQSSNGSSLGNYDFSVISGPFNYLIDSGTDTQSAIASGGSYFEHLGGYGTFSISGTGLPTLLGGGSNFFGVSIWAAPGGNSATMEFDLDNFATSQVVTLPNEPLYLDVTGTTASPVTLTDLTPGQTPDFWAFTDPLTIDYTLTLSDTPFSPTSGSGTPPGSDVPEPWSWTVMLAGLLGLALPRRRLRLV